MLHRWTELSSECKSGASPCQGLQSSFAKLADGLVERSVEVGSGFLAKDEGVSSTACI